MRGRRSGGGGHVHLFWCVISSVECTQPLLRLRENQRLVGAQGGSARFLAKKGDPPFPPEPGHFLFSFKLMVTVLRESKELTVLVELEDP